MDLGKLASLSVGLAGFIGGLWIVLQIIKSVRRNGTARQENHSGEQSTVFWKTEIRAAVEETLFKTAPKRHEDLAALIEKVLEQEFLKRNEKLQQMIHKEVTDAMREYFQ